MVIGVRSCCVSGDPFCSVDTDPIDRSSSAESAFDLRSRSVLLLLLSMWGTDWLGLEGGQYFVPGGDTYDLERGDHASLPQPPPSFHEDY